MSAGERHHAGDCSAADWLQAVVESWGGPIYVVTPDYRLRFMNRRLIGRLGRDATGESCFRVLYDRHEPCPWCAQEVFRGEPARNRLQQPADGRWYEVLHTPLRLPDGTFAKIAFIRENPELPPSAKELPVFQMLVDRLSDAVFFHAPATGRVLYVNETACSNLGFLREELLRMHAWDYSEMVVSPAEWRQRMSELEAAGELTFESRHRRRDGSCFDVEVKATAVQVGLERYIVSVARDITERKKAAARLVEERNKIEAIMEAIGDGITVQDRDFRILYQNEMQIARQGEHLGEFCYRAYLKRDRVCDDCQVVESFADGRIRRRQVAIDTPLGTLHQEITACPLRDGNGTVVACVEVVRDITEQKKMEQALQESNEKYRLLFAAESDAILTYDAQSGEITEVNDSACQLYGIERAAFVGRCWFDLLAEVGDSTADGQDLVVHRRGDGTFFPVEFSSGRYQWQGRSMMVAVVRDVGERLRQERSREEVFSVIGHEMRTPLTAILGFAEHLLEGEAEETRREFLQLIVRDSERMWHLIDNLLSLKRLLAGFGLENPVAIPLPPLLREAVESFRTPLPRQTIEIRCPDDLRPIVGDAETILQALKNLIGNAIKYSPLHTTIVLGAHAEEEGALLWVRDEGPGIPADQQERIFERFYRVGGRRGPVGTGLGLALVREIAHAHGGRVWVESAPAAGSTFYMSLPFADFAAPAAKIPSRSRS